MDGAKISVKYASRRGNCRVEWVLEQAVFWASASACEGEMRAVYPGLPRKNAVLKHFSNVNPSKRPALGRTVQRELTAHALHLRGLWA